MARTRDSLLCKFGFHKWKMVKDSYPDCFLGVKIRRYYIRFKICQRCGQCREYFHDSWIPLDEEQSKILMSKIIDKGEYYLLKRKDSHGTHEDNKA